MTAASLQLPEILAALSLATDLANAQPFETGLRTCALAVALADAAGASSGEVDDVYYAGLLHLVGCTAFSHEGAAVFGGDDNALHRTLAPIDSRRTLDLLPIASRFGQGRGTSHRLRAVKGLFTGGAAVFAQFATSSCEVALRFGTRLGMRQGVREGLTHLFERWDGRGRPEGLEGEAISRVARVIQVARVAEVHTRRAGPSRALAVLRRRAGGQLDPRLVTTFAAAVPELLDVVATGSVWNTVVARGAISPAPSAAIGLEEAARAFADFADLKSVYMLGHSSAVAALAEAAAGCLGWPEPERLALRHAALLHDLGRVSVPAGIWDKKGPLTLAEWEQVRLHPYYTERILARSPLLAPLAAIAGAHHERLDGSGYFRSASAALLPRAGRVLAAADFYQAMIEMRPHRPAWSREEASRVLEGEAASGRLDRDAVTAVLEAGGHLHRVARRAWPMGLTDREVEVLRWVAKGRSNKEVAVLLAISPRTVQHHVMHVYEKIGVASRAGAALFAMENQLLPA